MNFGTAASIGLEVLQNSGGMGAAVKGALSAAQFARGQGFAQVAQKLGLSSKLGAQAGQALERFAVAAQSQNSGQILNGLQYFDTDKNGTLTREELNQGLQKLQDLGGAQSGATAKLYQLGDNLLKNYDRLSAQDGNASLSYRDVGMLMGKDGQQGTLSTTDWQRLNTP